MSADNRESNILALQDTKAAVGALGLPLPRFVPRRYRHRNIGSWSGHLAFANDLIVAIRPSLIVELGTHWGEAYFTFCQTVQEEGLSSLCYAVDHWLGDEHAGHYGEEVFDDVRQYNERYYGQFSYLLRSSFDDALPQFSDSSIDLLHVDGLHTYEAASNDFRKWLPKVRPGGIVLLHDICPKHEEFGVWRVWDEIRAEFRDTFEFHHSWGLGVLRKDGGLGTSPLLEILFSRSPAAHEELRRRYNIYASHLDNLLTHSPEAAREMTPLESASEIRVQVFPFGTAGYAEETSLFQKMKPGSWTTLSFELPEGIGQGPLRIDPAHDPSLIEIGEISLYSFTSGEVLWSVAAPSGWKSVTVAGTAATVPSCDRMMLISFGDDPQLILNMPPSVQGPVKLTMSLRATPTPLPAPEIVDGLIKDVQATAEQQSAAARAERDNIREQLDQATWARDQAVSERRNLQERLLSAEVKLHAEEAVRMGMQHSLSWRITGPARKLMGLLRSGSRTAP
jgi:hypothetical protein